MPEKRKCKYKNCEREFEVSHTTRGLTKHENACLGKRLKATCPYCGNVYSSPGYLKKTHFTDCVDRHVRDAYSAAYSTSGGNHIAARAAANYVVAWAASVEAAWEQRNEAYTRTMPRAQAK